MDVLQKYLSIILLYLTTQIQLHNCSKILAIFPVPFREHQIVYRPLIEGLVNHGHELVVLTTDPMINPMNNVTQIDLSFTYDLRILNNLKDTSLSGSEMLKTIFETMRQISDEELKSNEIQNLLNQNERFDAVIVEWFGVSVMNAFAYRFNAPLIGISSGGALMNSHIAFGNPTHPIAYPNVLLPFSEDLNLIQRMASVVFTIWYRYLYFNIELPQQNELARKYFGTDLPDLWDIESQASLLLINSYQSLGNVRPHGPSTIFLGGIHTNPMNVLSKDLDLFLETSVNGVVYINMGSTQSPCISDDRLETLLYAVAKLKLDIVWNCEIPIQINTTTKIYYSHDNYQEDVLAHNKVIVFLTNGGQRNIEDAIHYKVPVLGISKSTYVEHYLRQIQKHRAGIISYIDFETNEEFTELIRSIMNDNVYKHNIEKLNRLILDKPMSSIETAIWWIEYTIRQHGTAHLNSPMKSITWVQYLMLDVLAAILFITLFLIYCCHVILNRLREYSKSLPVERVTRGSKCKVL